MVAADVRDHRRAGPVSSFLVVSDPAAAKHVLRSTDNPKRPIYVKGLVAEVWGHPEGLLLFMRAKPWTEVGMPSQVGPQHLKQSVVQHNQCSQNTKGVSMLDGVTCKVATGSRVCHRVCAAQVSEFLFGDGFAISGGDDWRVRRRAVGPSLHKGYLEAMVSRVFGPSAQHLAAKLEVPLPGPPFPPPQA